MQRMGKGSNSDRQEAVKLGNMNEKPNPENKNSGSGKTLGEPAPDSIINSVSQNQITDDVLKKPLDPKRSSTPLLLLANVFDVLTLGVTLPVLPSLFTEFGLTTTHQGWATSAYSLLFFIMGPILGRWSDLYGRVVLLRVSAIVSLLGYIGLAAAGNKWAFLAVRILPGLAKCQIPISQAYLADVSTSAASFGMLGAAFGLGFIFGPLIGGFAAGYGLRYPVYVAVASSLLNLLTLCFLPEPRVHKKKDAGTKVSMMEFMRGQSTKTLLLLLHNRFSFMFGESLYQSTFIMHFTRNLGLSGSQVGFLLSYVGVAALFSNLVAVRFLSKNISEWALLILVTFAESFCMVVVFGVSDIKIVCVVLLIMTINSSAFNTVTSAQISKSVSPENIGTVMGISSAVDTIVRIICPPLAGLIFDKLGNIAAGSVAAASILYCCLGTMSSEAVEPYINSDEDKKKQQ
mmetsp:Transcript_28077/g.36455  ORF Transcript_28077/g.36455 Transcript_28077/m.36455 type:complete len:459 (+) Transcript_28077:123-1499(+)